MGQHPTAHLLQQCIWVAYLAPVSAPVHTGSPPARLKLQSAAAGTDRQVHGRTRRLHIPATAVTGWGTSVSLRAKVLTAFVCLAVACLLPLQPSAWNQSGPSQPDALLSTGLSCAIGARCVVQHKWNIDERVLVCAGDTVEVLSSPIGGSLL